MLLKGRTNMPYIILGKALGGKWPFSYLFWHLSKLNLSPQRALVEGSSGDRSGELLGERMRPMLGHQQCDVITSSMQRK